MRSKMTVVAWIATAAVGLIVAACGGSSGDKTTSSAQSSQPAALQKGSTIRLWVMNNGPQPVQDTKRIVQGFERQTGVNVDVELVGWDVHSTASATPPSRAAVPTSPRRAPPRCRSSPRSTGSPT